MDYYFKRMRLRTLRKGEQIEEYSKYMNIAGADWDMVFSGSYIGMLGWLEYNVKRALGIEVSDENEIALGEEQVIGTMKELYSYQEKLQQVKEWISCGKYEF